MEKLVSHIHTLYSMDGSNNPEVVLRNARKKDFYAEIVAHNSLVWTRKYPDVARDEMIITGVEFRIRGVDIVASGGNVDEISKDKRFQLYSHKTPNGYDVPLPEALDLLRDCSEYVYFPHPSTSLGIGKSCHEDLIEKGDGVEIWNGNAALIPGANADAMNLAGKYKKTRLAGLDDHYGCHGLLPAYNLLNASCKDDIYDAVRKGRTLPYVKRKFPILMAKEYSLTAIRSIMDMKQVITDTRKGLP
jgi:hypothetical protein